MSTPEIVIATFCKPFVAGSASDEGYKSDPVALCDAAIAC
jgi:hypothetical protein